jgi:hypothetical protein
LLTLRWAVRPNLVCRSTGARNGCRSVAIANVWLSSFRPG